jgi:hypothetical protein
MKNLILILIVIPALITGACAVTATAEEEYYTWVDENGITNYSERNPEGVNATFVSRNQAFGRRAAEEGRPKPQAQLPQNDTPVVDPDALVNEQAAAIAAEISEIGKSNLAQIKAFSRIRISDEQGENRILTDEEKEARGDKARGTIRENCTG